MERLAAKIEIKENPIQRPHRTNSKEEDDVFVEKKKVFIYKEDVDDKIEKFGEPVYDGDEMDGNKIDEVVVEADPNSTARPVELIGALESINKAEKLLKEVSHCCG